MRISMRRGLCFLLKTQTPPHTSEPVVGFGGGEEGCVMKELKTIAEKSICGLLVVSLGLFFLQGCAMSDSDYNNYVSQPKNPIGRSAAAANMAADPNLFDSQSHPDCDSLTATARGGGDEYGTWHSIDAGQKCPGRPIKRDGRILRGLQ